MWSRLDDDLLHHDKTEEAARAFGRRRGLVTALGTVAFGLLYANWKLTDGFLHDDVLDRYGIDAEQRKVMTDVRFWERDDARHGYIVHDFHELNPTAAAVKAKREKDRRRKLSRAGFQQDSTKESTTDSAVESTKESTAESTWNRGGIPSAATSRVPRPAPPRPDQRSSPAARPGALRGKESEETQPPAGAQSTGAAAPGHARAPRVGFRPPDRPGFAQVVELVRKERDRLTAAQIPFDRPELIEQCKLVAARAHLVYDGATLGRALEAVEHAERRR